MEIRNVWGYWPEKVDSQCLELVKRSELRNYQDACELDAK